MTIEERQEGLWRKGKPPKEDVPVVTTNFIVQVDRIIRDYLIDKPFENRQSWMDQETLNPTWPVMTISTFRKVDKFTQEP